MNIIFSSESVSSEPDQALECTQRSKKVERGIRKKRENGKKFKSFKRVSVPRALGDFGVLNFLVKVEPLFFFSCVSANSISGVSACPVKVLVIHQSRIREIKRKISGKKFKENVLHSSFQSPCRGRSFGSPFLFFFVYYSQFIPRRLIWV